MNIKNHKITFGAGLSALAFSTILTSTAQAQTCTTVPSCSTLGYTKSASDCSGLDYLRCPFDQSKYFCTKGSSGGGGSVTPDPPVHTYKGTLVGRAWNHSCSESWGEYTLTIDVWYPECRLPAGTISFDRDMIIKVSSDEAYPQVTYSSEDECWSAGFNKTKYNSDITIGKCNSLADYTYSGSYVSW